MTLDDATIASRLAASLPSMRWFADKGDGIAGVALQERVVVSQEATVGLVLVEVHLSGRDAAPRYVVMTDADGNDAAATPDAARWLLDVVLSGRSAPGRGGRFVGHPAGKAVRPDFVAPTAPVTVSQIGGDASNTSLLVRCDSAGWVVKVFRRCREGIQPEVEIGEFFADLSPWHDTPGFRGWLAYESAHGSTAIATVHEFAPGHSTGWDRLVTLLTAGDGLTGRSGDEVLAIVDALGRATASMHRAFSARPDIPAFAPEPATAAVRRAMATRMRGHAEDVFSSIESRLPRCEPAIARRLAGVLKSRSTLVDRFDGLTNIPLDTSDIRVHGDYHLGQVLVAQHDSQVLVAEHDSQQRMAERGGVLVIDFEGEPGRPLAERREKTAAAKDVAGMCRSFDYLLRHVAKATGRPYAAADSQRLEARFLDAYRQGAAGQCWWPADRTTADDLLAAFKLDKAIYELAYELNNRPDWIDVPLAAIEEAVATADRSPGRPACHPR